MESEKKPLIKLENEISDLIGLKLLKLPPEYEGDEKYDTMLYIAGEPFIVCKSLMIAIPEREEELEQVNSINNIDELRDLIGEPEDDDLYYYTITPEEEFWGHCSNVQAWYEHDYDTRLVASGFGFSVLKRLAEVGDQKARKVYKDEIFKRFAENYDSTLISLFFSGALDLLTREEYWSLFPESFTPLRKVEELLGVPPFYQGGMTDVFGKKKDPLDPFWPFRPSSLAFVVEDQDATRNDKRPRLAVLLIGGSSVTDPEIWAQVFAHLGEMEHLHHLIIEECIIPDVPESIGLLTGLRQLEMTECKIESLPDSFKNLTRLESLKLSKNNIKAFPEPVTRLPRLKILYLFSNPLERIPDSVMTLKSLESFGVDSPNTPPMSRDVEKWQYTLDLKQHIKMLNEYLEKKNYKAVLGRCQRIFEYIDLIGNQELEELRKKYERIAMQAKSELDKKEAEQARKMSV